MKLPLNNGICLTCADIKCCPMTKMLPEWENILVEHGEEIKDARPDLFDEFSIDVPIIEDGIIKWCPMHYEKRKVKAAAYIRNDGVLAIGKCHADIIKASPYGTCKNGSVSGFIDNHGQFISRERAWEVALEARQIKIEKIRKRGEYLLSEEIWSDVDNGDWTYDDEQGYILKKDRE